MTHYKFDTDCVHGNYRAGSGQPQVFPIVQSTTYRYYDCEDVAKLFNLESAEFMYSRLGNPTVNMLEEKFAKLEGGSGAICTSSGQAANLITILNVCKAGDNILATSNMYGGTFNLFNVTLRKMGIEARFFNQDMEADDIVSLADDKTKILFGESLGNPSLSVLDFEKFRQVAEETDTLFVVDNTLATPALCRPLEYGAHIVTHSTTKYADGHGTSVGGIVVEGGNFDWSKSEKFRELTEPDDSYHGLKYSESFGECAFSVKLRAQMLRDLGCTMSPMNAFMTAQGLATLPLRMAKHSENAMKLAQFLENHSMVEWVKYPGLEKDEYYELATKYLKNGASGVLSFGLKGGKDIGEEFIKSLCLTSQVVHVGDIRTSVLHPASTTHRQLSQEEQMKAGIPTELIRVSVGIEDIRDIIEDFEQAFNEVK